MNVHMFKDKNGNAITEESPEVNELINRIVKELLEDTVAYAYDGIKHIQLFPNKSTNPRVTPEDLCNIPYDLRPQLTGDYLKEDIILNIDDPDGTFIGVSAGAPWDFVSSLKDMDEADFDNLLRKYVNLVTDEPLVIRWWKVNDDVDW